MEKKEAKSEEKYIEFLIKHQQERLRKKYGFIANHRKTDRHNISIILSELPALPFLSKSRRPTCHNKCTTLTPP